MYGLRSVTQRRSAFKEAPFSPVKQTFGLRGFFVAREDLCLQGTTQVLRMTSELWDPTGAQFPI
jgi:hypothetical protein